MRLLTNWREKYMCRKALEAARLRPTLHIAIAEALAIAGLIAALIATGEAAYTKYQSDQAIAAAEQMVSTFEAQVSRLEDDGAPPYQIRFAQLRLEAARNMLNRIKADERAYTDAYGRNATDAALMNYIKGKLVVSDFVAAADNAFNSSKALSDAYSARPGEIQQNYEGAVRRLLGNDTTLQGDALDRYIAVAEYQHLVRMLKEQGYNPSDPTFVNTVRRFVKDYYVQDGESPPPDEVRSIMEGLIAETYGLPMPVELEEEDTSWMMPDLPPTLEEAWHADEDSDLLPTPFTPPAATAEPAADASQGSIEDLNAAFRTFDDSCIALRQNCYDRMTELKGNAWSGYTPECANNASGLIFDSKWWTMAPSYGPCAQAAAATYLASLQADADAYVAGTLDRSGYEANGKIALATLRSSIAVCRATACQNGCAANDQTGTYTGTPGVDDNCTCQ